MASDNDTGYKLLFSHPEMVRDLITGYIPGEWVSDADFSTLERINASYVSDNERTRHDDMVWRVRIGESWLWVYLMLEFQSRPDRWMAVRMLVYLGLLAQDLVRRQELHNGKLPPILPVVLYNGAPVWNAPLDVADCFVHAPGGLQAYLPHMVYHLIDEARLKLHPSPAVRNFADALFMLEHGRKPDDIRLVLQALNEMLKTDAARSLRRAFGVWIKSLLLRKAPAHRISEIESIDDIMEADTMLAERIESWFEEAARKGMQQGEARILLRLLAQRFGNIPEEIVQRIESADADTLLKWSERLLGASTLEEVVL